MKVVDRVQMGLVECRKMPDNISVRGEDTDDTADQIRSSGYGRAGIGQSSSKGLSSGRHVNAPVRCSCSQLWK